MASFLRGVLSGLRNFVTTPEQDSGPFVPDYLDVCKARALLNALKLPTELALDILEYAQYWPAVTWSMPSDNSTCTASASGPHNSQARLFADIPVADNNVFNNLCSVENKVQIKSIEFHVKSKDQGWTSERTHGTFSTSSWLEVSILRQQDGIHADSVYPIPQGPYESPQGLHEALAPQGQMLVKRPEHLNQGPQGGEGDFAWYLQGNRVASPPSTYSIIWTRDSFQGNEGAGRGEGFLKALENGDRLLIWARAKVFLQFLFTVRLSKIANSFLVAGVAV
jgi:hypothetical protein